MIGTDPLSGAYSSERPQDARTLFASSRRFLRMLSSARSSAKAAGSAINRRTSSSPFATTLLSSASLMLVGSGRMTAESIMRGTVSMMRCRKGSCRLLAQAEATARILQTHLIGYFPVRDGLAGRIERFLVDVRTE